MKSKFLLTLSSIALISTALSGCGGKKAGADDDPNKANLHIGTLDKGIGTTWLTNAAAAFEELYKDSEEFQPGRKGVKVHVTGSTQYDGDYIMRSTLNKDIYFTEGIPYNEVINRGKLLPLTEMMNEKLTAYGETRSIKDKIDESFLDYLTVNNELYAVPFYDSFYGLVYDVNLWNERSLYISSDGGFTNKEGNLSVGSDNIPGTLDDGLPATFEEFANLMYEMRNSNITPFITSTAGIEYTANYLYNFVGHVEGHDQMMLNFTFDGTATNLINVDSNGTVTKLDPVTITDDNAYMLTKQEGRYKTLKFVEDILLSHAENRVNDPSHTVAQQTFVNSKQVSEKPIAMICEGSWWENEARNAIANYEKTYGEKTNYAIMPIPFENSEVAAAMNYKHTYLSLSQSFGIVSKNSQQKKLAFEFMKFLHTDKMLSKFTADTSITRPLNYDIAEEDQAHLSTYARSLIDLKKNSDIVYPYSSNTLVNNNLDVFNAYHFIWNTRIGGPNGNVFRHPFMYFGSANISNPTAKAYFDGQYEYISSKWKGLVK
ncbi:MAG: extracellular solute-binding protein [Bacilli bacterium]|nr:extracellular solute-binding protein [Bacilli bacterium]